MEDNSSRVLDEEEEQPPQQEEEFLQENGGGDDDDDDDDNDDDDDDDDNDDDDDDDDNDDDDDDDDDDEDDDDNDYDDDDDDDDDDYDKDDSEINNIQLLFETEINNHRLKEQRVAIIINDVWTQEARNHALRYIVNTGKELGFRLPTLYISVMYLNRFLGTRRVQFAVYGAVRLLAVACLSLAAKVEESCANVPLLSEYPLGHWNLNLNHIRRMEILVQDVFNWNMECVSPFPFALFFLSRFNRDISEATRKRTFNIILTTFRDVSLMNDQRPSAIAAAAILLALNNNLTRQEWEIEINDLPLSEFLNTDNVWYCYNRLQ